MADCVEKLRPRLRGRLSLERRSSQGQQRSIYEAGSQKSGTMSRGLVLCGPASEFFNSIGPTGTPGPAARLPGEGKIAPPVAPKGSGCLWGPHCHRSATWQALCCCDVCPTARDLAEAARAAACADRALSSITRSFPTTADHAPMAKCARSQPRCGWANAPKWCRQGALVHNRKILRRRAAFEAGYYAAWRAGNPSYRPLQPLISSILQQQLGKTMTRGVAAGLQEPQRSVAASDVATSTRCGNGMTGCKAARLKSC